MTRTDPHDVDNTPRFDTCLVRGEKHAESGGRLVDEYIPDDYPDGAWVELSIPIPGLNMDWTDRYQIVRPYSWALPAIKINGEFVHFRDRVHGSNWGVRREVFEPAKKTLRDRISELPAGTLFRVGDLSATYRREDGTRVTKFQSSYKVDKVSVIFLDLADHVTFASRPDDTPLVRL